MASAESKSNYEGAVGQLATALTPEDLEAAVDAYLEAADAAESGIEDDVAFSALVAGDLRVLAHLSDLDPGDQGEPVALSVDGDALSSFTADMRQVASGIDGGAPPTSPDDVAPVALGAATPAEIVVQAIDAIITEATTAEAKVFAAMVPPTGDDLVNLATAIGGQTGAELAKKAVEAAEWVTRAVKRAIARVLGALLDRLSRWMRETDAAQLIEKGKAWVSNKIKEVNPVALLLDGSGLKERAGGLAEDDAAKAIAEKATALVEAHAGTQRWIGWGATGLAAAKTLQLNKAAPWGPALMGGAFAVLVIACMLIANDYLDGRDWPPQRVAGVRGLLPTAG